jgi:hypothetical protein
MRVMQNARLIVSLCFWSSERKKQIVVQVVDKEIRADTHDSKFVGVAQGSV